jgi:hypothetical protein
VQVAYGGGGGGDDGRAGTLISIPAGVSTDVVAARGQVVAEGELGGVGDDKGAPGYKVILKLTFVLTK